MIEIGTNLIPIALGFLAQMTANKAQREAKEKRFLLETYTSNVNAISGVRAFASKENRSAKWFRRALVFVILTMFISPYLVAPFFGIDLIIQTKQQVSYFFGLFETEEVIFNKVSGLMKFEEIFRWATMILEFYFGSQFARNK